MSGKEKKWRCAQCGSTDLEEVGANGKKNLPAPRDHRWVIAKVQAMTEASWQTGRARKEALVVFDFWRWRRGIKRRVVWNDARERDTVKLVNAYGLVRVLLAIEGQAVHPDFNHDDGKTYHGYDNLIRPRNGYANVEKCSDVAIEQGRFEAVLRCVGKLAEKRGWTPSEADEELLEAINA